MTKRIAMLPFVYRVEGVPKGKMKLQVVDMLDSVPVEIREIAKDEAPVVLESRLGDYRRHDGVLLRRMQGEVNARNARGADGVIRFERIRNAVGIDELDATISSLVTAISSDAPGDWSDLVDELSLSAGPLQKARPASEVEFKRISSTNEDEARAAAIEAWPRNLLLVDGELWCKSEEPALKVTGTTYLRGGDMEINIVDKADWGNCFYKTFRIDRIADAVAFAERQANGHDVKLDRVGTLLDARGWSIDDVGHDTRRTAEYLHEQMHSMAHQIIWMHPDFFAALVEFREMDAATTGVEELAGAIVALGRAATMSDNPKCKGFASTVEDLAGDLEWLWTRARRSMEVASDADDMADLALGMGAGRA